jgi:serine phosphatase RsbU (regulator of sigma subunit)
MSRLSGIANRFSFIITPMMILLFAASCSDETSPDKGSPLANKVQLSAGIDSLLKDSVPVSPLVDSLKKVFYSSNDSLRIDILAQLSENWRDFSLPLAEELQRIGQENKDPFAEAKAWCEMGIYVYRASNLDSAVTLFDKAYALGEANKLDRIKAEVNGWKGEVERRRGNREKAIKLFDEALNIAEKTGSQKVQAFCYMVKAETLRSMNEFDKAFDCYNKSIAISKQTNDPYKIIICYNGMGDAKRVQGDYVQSLNYFNKSMDLAKKNGYKRPLAYALHTMGDVYCAQKEFDKALANYKEAAKIAEELQDKQRLAEVYNGMGNAYRLSGKNDLAFECYNRCIKLSEEAGNQNSLALSYNGLGTLYQDKKQFGEALDYFQKAYEISELSGNKGQLCDDLRDMAECYFGLGEFGKAKEASEKALTTAQEGQLMEIIKQSAFMLYKINSKQNNPAAALKMLSLYIETKDSLSNEEQVKQFAAVEYAAKEQGLKAEQKAKEDTYKAEQARKEEELKRQKTIRYAFTIGFVLVLALVVIVYRNLRENKRKNRIITEQKKEVEHAKELVEEKHKEITDSINYAERIQRSFLATKEMLDQNLKEYFVFFRPKDVVSGDFYWAYKLSAGNFALATADSTGHGVPGSIMSLLNITSLEKACEHSSQPAEILNHTRKTIIERLKKDGSSEGGKDGMDCSLISFDFANKTMTYAAANNPVWVVRGNELLEFAPDKMPVGKHDKDQVPFVQHIVQLQAGDMVYTLTDGMPDQFGGPRGKKFMYKQLKELLISISTLPSAAQKEKLNEAFDQWKGPLEQVDDVTVIGIRI